MTIETVSDMPAQGLRESAADVALPGEPAYDAGRQPWNVALDLRPAAVVKPRSVDEVVATVRSAAAAGLRIAPQSSGHNAGPLGALADVVVVKMSELNRVEIDPVARCARVEGGAVWLDAVNAAGEHGLGALHGSAPDVGIAGYSLGGGIGWYARRHGLQANSVTAVELVLADGSHVRADAIENAPLFWAVRGGGGNFGVVTALEFDLYPIESAYAGLMLWDVSAAEKVLRRWADWAADAPDAVTTSFRVLRMPPIPELPDFLRGRELVVIDGAVLEDDERAAQLLAPLSELQPELNTFGRLPAPALSNLHMDPEQPTPFVSEHAMFDALPDAALDAYLGEVGPGSRTTLLLAEIRQLGGALGRPAVGAGALPKLDAQFLMFAGAVAASPELAAQGRIDASSLAYAMQPFANGRNYLNFAENAVDPKSAYDAEAWKQLKSIRSVADPDGVFVANHAIPRHYEDGRPTA